MDNRVRVKICGITNQEDALMAVNLGAWALGFIFYKKSPRYISPSKARRIIEALPPFVTPVGVFVNQKERAVRDICQLTRIKTLQMHGDEPAVFCKRFKDYKIIKAFRVDNYCAFNGMLKYKVDAYLFDTFREDVYGGSGETFDWNLLPKDKITRPFILSGGLNPENIARAVETVEPFAVDVSSGVEKSPGVKNYHLLKSFFDRIESVRRKG